MQDAPQTNPFAKYAQPRQSGPVYGPGPSQADLQERDLDQRKMAIDEQRLGMDQVRLQREMQDGGGATQGFTDAGKLRDEFMGSQSVKDISAVLPSYSAALQTPDTAEGDMSLIYAFAKMMDPNSVVRESEFESAASNDTIFGQTVARIRKEIGAGGRLRPDARQRLRAEMIRRFGQMQDAYGADRNRYITLAQRGGFDPMLVVGDNHVKTYADDFRRVAANMRGGEPRRGGEGAGDIGFNTESTPQGLSDQQAAAYDAFLKANPNATADDLAGFARTIGFELHNAEEIIRARPELGVRPGMDAEIKPQDQVVNDMLGQTDAAGSFVRGAADTGLFGFVDEARAGAQALTGSLSGGGSFSDLYGQNVVNERAYQDRLADIRPISFHGGQLAGALMVPYGSGIRSASGLAKLGAAEGGAYGFGSSEGNPIERIPGAAVGATVGGVAGGTIGTIAPKVTGRLSDMMRRQPDDLDTAVVQAGERQGINIRQPDARPSTRADFAGVEASPTGNPIVSRTLDEDRAATQARLEKVGGEGRPLDDYELGETLQNSSNRYLAESGAQANVLYRRAEQLAGDTVADTSNAVRAIDEQIAELAAEGAQGNAGQIKYLEDIRADLQGGGSIQLLRGLRRNMRGQMDERGLTSSGADRRIGIVLDALSNDIARTLPADAQTAFAKADGFYRQRMQLKDQVLRRFIGNASDPIPPEQAAARFNSFMRSKDFGRFKRMLDTLDPEERLDVAATVAERLGQNRNGDFGYAALVSNTEKMSDRAMVSVFGEDGAAAIRDLQIIARAKRDTAGELNNSRTGAVNSRMGLRDTVWAMAGGGLANVPGAAAGLALSKVSEKIGNRRMAKLLLNPDFTKWMRQAPPTDNPKAVRAYAERLTAVASRNPIIAGEARAMQDLLIEAFAQSPGRAAAEQENNGR